MYTLYRQIEEQNLRFDRMYAILEINLFRHPLGNNRWYWWTVGLLSMCLGLWNRISPKEHSVPNGEPLRFVSLTGILVRVNQNRFFPVCAHSGLPLSWSHSYRNSWLPLERKRNLELGASFSYLGLDSIHLILWILRPLASVTFLCSHGTQDTQECISKMSTRHCGVTVLGNVERSLIMKFRDEESMKTPNLQT